MRDCNSCKNYVPKDSRVGWICPTCGANIAPWLDTCPNHSKPDLTIEADKIQLQSSFVSTDDLTL